jgi:hypothetical protein
MKRKFEVRFTTLGVRFVVIENCISSTMRKTKSWDFGQRGYGARAIYPACFCRNEVFVSVYAKLWWISLCQCRLCLDMGRMFVAAFRNSHLRHRQHTHNFENRAQIRGKAHLALTQGHRILRHFQVVCFARFLFLELVIPEVANRI